MTLMYLLQSLLVATAVAGPSPQVVAAPTDPSRRDAECLVSLQAERGISHGDEAKSYFDRRVQGIEDAEVRELVMISAEEAILSNTNRREIASTCAILYQVMKLQEDRAATPPATTSSPANL